MHRKTGLFFVVFALAATSLWAVPTVTVVQATSGHAPTTGYSIANVVGNSVFLLPGTQKQIIDVMVSGIDPSTVQGLNLFVQTGDGGPGIGGTIVGPGLTGGPAFTGSATPGFDFTNNIFTGITGGISDSENTHADGIQSIAVSVSTTSGSFAPSAAGLLARLVIDTTNPQVFTALSRPQGWHLDFLGTNVSGDSDFAGIAGIWPGGQGGQGQITLFIVPEPTSIVMGFFAAAGLGVVMIRRRARKAA